MTSNPQETNTLPVGVLEEMAREIDPWAFQPGGDEWLRERAREKAALSLLTPDENQ